MLATEFKSGGGSYALSYELPGGAHGSRTESPGTLEAILKSGNEDVYYVYSGFQWSFICEKSISGMQTIKQIEGSYRSNCAGPGDHIIIATSYAVHNYNSDDHGIDFLSYNEAEHVLYEPVHNKVITAAEKTFRIIDYNTQSIEFTLDFNGNILDIFAVHNK